MPGLSYQELGERDEGEDGPLFNGTEVSTAHLRVSEGVLAHLLLRGAITSLLVLP